MTCLGRALLLLAALSTTAFWGALRAEEPAPAVPAGYEEAAQPDEAKAEPTAEEPADAEKKEADIPEGYEDSGQAKKANAGARQRVVIRAVQPAPAAGAIAQRAQALADNPQLKALAVQMRQQLRPYFAAELTFAKEVCQPTPEQLQKMKALATPELEKAIREYALLQEPALGGVAIVRGAQQSSGDILDEFEAAADRIVSQVFADEVKKKYQTEQKQRKEFRARAGAMSLVANLDTKLRLSAEQREALTDSLQKAWQRDWPMYLQIMENNPQFFPPLPNKSILPHLTDIQAEQWKSMPRNRLGFGWQNLANNGLFRNEQEDSDWFEQEEAVENLPANIQFLMDVLQVEEQVIIEN